MSRCLPRERVPVRLPCLCLWDIIYGMSRSPFILLITHILLAEKKNIEYSNMTNIRVGTYTLDIIIFFKVSIQFQKKTEVGDFFVGTGFLLNPIVMTDHLDKAYYDCLKRV